MLIGSICLTLVLAALLLPACAPAAPEEVAEEVAEEIAELEAKLAVEKAKTDAEKAKISDLEDEIAALKEPEKVDIAYFSGTWGDLLANPVAAADIINTYHPYIRISVVKSAGSEMNTMMAATMPPNSVIYHTCSMDLIAGYYGLSPWEEAYPNQTLLLGFPHSEGMFYYATWDKNIRKFEDLAGRSLAILPLPSLVNPYTDYVLDALGIKGEVKIVNLDFGPLEDALRDKKVDAILYFGQGPPGKEASFAGMEEVLYALKDEVYVIPVPGDIVKAGAASLKAGFSVKKVDASRLLPKGEGEIWTHVAQFSMISSLATMDEELAYGIVKTIIDHVDEFAWRVPPRGEYLTAEAIARGMDFAPDFMIHPGAIRYYKEAGLWDYYLEARAKFLAEIGE